jgi:dUTP pyrophosphatase
MYILYLTVDESLREWYEERVSKHNEKCREPYADSGFDLACPEDVPVKAGSYFVDFKVKGAMYQADTPSAYFLYPRSSISKTSFRLANSTGIIDRGYRGNLGAFFDCMVNSSIEKGQRLVQICSPTLEPFEVRLVDSLSSTERGENGFGSTG